MKAKYFILAITALYITSCKPNEEGLEDKVSELEEIEAQINELKTQKGELEKEITAIDPNYFKGAQNSTLVTVFKPLPRNFNHQIEIRGAVESRKNVSIASEVMGPIQSISVSPGAKVSRGQLLVKIDNSILENNIDEVKKALELADAVYQRQDRLWQQNIGTEIQFLEAKNRKESLEKQLATLKTQASKYEIRAPFSGSIDDIPVREGEMAQPGLGLLRIVNPYDMYIKADVSENFIGKFKKGDDVVVGFTNKDKEISSHITSIGQVINKENRTFEIEVKLPASNGGYKPNQVTILKLKDYQNDKAIVVPTYLVQKDNLGKYVYVINEEEEQSIANKQHIETGLSFNGETEVVEGLSQNQSVADKGFRDLSEGTVVQVTDNTNLSQL